MKQIGPKEFWKQVMMENYSKEPIIFIVAKTGRKKSAWSLVMTDLKWQNTAVWHFPWSIDRYQMLNFLLYLLFRIYIGTGFLPVARIVEPAHAHQSKGDDEYKDGQDDNSQSSHLHRLVRRIQ